MTLRAELDEPLDTLAGAEAPIVATLVADGTVSEDRSRAGEIIRELNPMTTATLAQWPRQ